MTRTTVVSLLIGTMGAILFLAGLVQLVVREVRRCRGTNE